MARRCGGVGWLALGVDQHLPASFYPRGLGASRERVFAPGFLWLGGQAPGSTLGAFVSHPRYLAPGSRAWPARPSRAWRARWRGRLGPVSSPGRVLLPLDLNSEACVASTAVYLEALRRSERFLRPRGRLGYRLRPGECWCPERCPGATFSGFHASAGNGRVSVGGRRRVPAGHPRIPGVLTRSGA